MSADHKLKLITALIMSGVLSSTHLLAANKVAEVEDRSILAESNHVGDLNNFTRNRTNSSILPNSAVSRDDLYGTNLASNLNKSYGNLPHTHPSEKYSSSAGNQADVKEQSKQQKSVYDQDSAIVITETAQQADKSMNNTLVITGDTISDKLASNSDDVLDSKSNLDSDVEQQKVVLNNQRIKDGQDLQQQKEHSQLANNSFGKKPNLLMLTEPERPVNDINLELVQDEEINSSAVENSNRELVLRELQGMPLGERLQRIENILEIQKNQQLENKIKILQEEIQSLRGVIESKYHKIEKNLAQQKLLYEDLDRRFSQTASIDQENSNSSAANGFVASKNEQQDLYTAAYRSIKQRDYDKAIELFTKYLNNYPKGIFCSNANYWLGEIYMIQSQYDKALTYFDKVLVEYPKSIKTADAMYKKGIVNIYKKDFSQAKKIFTEVKKKYHDTTVARLADQKLQGLENMNNDT